MVCGAVNWRLRPREGVHVRGGACLQGGGGWGPTASSARRVSGTSRTRQRLRSIRKVVGMRRVARVRRVAGRQCHRHVPCR